MTLTPEARKALAGFGTFWRFLWPRVIGYSGAVALIAWANFG